MKFNLFLLLFVLFSASVYSQSKNNISVYYGISNSDVDIRGAIGDYGYKPKDGIGFGLTYTRVFTKIVSVETGLQYCDDNVQMNAIQSFPSGITTVIRNGQAKFLSVPLNAKFTFLKYFYGASGLSADFQTNYTNSSVLDKQSGIGLEIGLGAKYGIGKVNVFVNAYAHELAVFHFSKDAHSNLLEDGLRFGLGYNF